MKIFIIAILVFAFNSVALAYREIQPAQSVCLESAASAAVIQLTKGDFHVIRDAKTGLISGIVNVETEESYDLAYLARTQVSEEFISFENEVHLLNIIAVETSSGVCKIKQISFFKNNGLH